MHMHGYDLIHKYSWYQSAKIVVTARELGMDGHLQLRRPPAIEKLAVSESTKHAGASSGKHGSAALSHEAPPGTSPRTVSKHHIPASPRTCLCSPTTHAGSFRCRLHRGITGGLGLGGGSVGSGLPEMGKKPGV
ncbi:hypothetical protein EJB05_41509, partial [Eragrostis curvula]